MKSYSRVYSTSGLHVNQADAHQRDIPVDLPAAHRAGVHRLPPTSGARGAMERRDLILAFGMSLLAAPLRPAAQPLQRVPRVGYLFSFTPAEGLHLWEACRRGLRELGYVEGHNILLE